MADGIIFWEGQILFYNGLIAMDLDCCCLGVPSCCDEDGGPPPTEVTVTVGGVGTEMPPDGCDCGDINGSYVLDISASDGDCCTYTGTFIPEDYCNVAYQGLAVEANFCRSDCGVTVNVYAIPNILPAPSVLIAQFIGFDCDAWPCPMTIVAEQVGTAGNCPCDILGISCGSATVSVA